MTALQQTEASRSRQTHDPVILTTGELAEILGLKGYQLAYLLESGRVPKPRKTLLGRRAFYTREDLEQIRRHLQGGVRRHELRRVSPPASSVQSDLAETP